MSFQKRSLLLLIILVLGLLTSCSANSNNTSKEEPTLLLDSLGSKEERNAEKGLKKIMKAISKGKITQTDNYVSAVDDKKKETFAEKAYGNYYKHLTYTIDETKMANEKEAAFVVSIETINFGDGIQDIMREIETKLSELNASDMPEEEWADAMAETTSEHLNAYIRENKKNRVTHTVDIYLEKKDGEWHLLIDDDFLNAIYGGAYDYINNG